MELGIAVLDHLPRLGVKPGPVGFHQKFYAQLLTDDPTSLRRGGRCCACNGTDFTACCIRKAGIGLRSLYHNCL